MKQWITRQWGRYELTSTKMQRFVAMIGTASMIATAIALGASVTLLFILTVGFCCLMGIAYILDKVGFQHGSYEEIFDQQQKTLYHRKVKLNAAEIATCVQMSPEDLKRALEEARRALRL